MGGHELPHNVQGQCRCVRLIRGSLQQLRQTILGDPAAVVSDTLCFQLEFPIVVARIAIGLALSSFATVLLTGYLFGISVTDSVTYSISAALVAAVAFSGLISRWTERKLARLSYGVEGGSSKRRNHLTASSWRSRARPGETCSSP